VESARQPSAADGGSPARLAANRFVLRYCPGQAQLSVRPEPGAFLEWRVLPELPREQVHPEPAWWSAEYRLE
jgi:hypothetical protein